MEFTLHYRGLLKPNGSPEEKHTIRKHFHSQLKELWNHQPLLEHKEFLFELNRGGYVSLEQPMGDFDFIPIVSSKIHAIAKLYITVLRPEPPGTLFSKSGDIDNRLKTLLDSLKVPNHSSALPPNGKPEEDESPFFCLLEDDSLITGFSVVTDRLLEPGVNPRDVDLSVQVRIGFTQVLRGTIGLLG